MKIRKMSLVILMLCITASSIHSLRASLSADKIAKGNDLAKNFELGKEVQLGGQMPQAYGFISINSADPAALKDGQKVIFQKERGTYIYALIHRSSIAISMNKNTQWVEYKPIRNKQYSRGLAILYTHPSWTGDAAIDKKTLEDIKNIEQKNSEARTKAAARVRRRQQHRP